MIFPHPTILHRESLRNKNGDDSFQSLSSFGSSSFQEEEDNREWDFSDQRGIDEFLKTKHQTRFTVGNISSSVFSRRFDGLFHATVRTFAGTRCQFCRYQWKHEYNNTQRDANLFMERNRTNVVHCLICNVNLCSNCTNEWHGIDMRDTKRLLGK